MIADLARRHWRTALGAVVGGGGGALYAHFVGCHTGTCAITSSIWTAGLFFGVTGALVAAPGPKRDAPRGGDRTAPERSP